MSRRDPALYAPSAGRHSLDEHKQLTKVVQKRFLGDVNQHVTLALLQIGSCASV